MLAIFILSIFGLKKCAICEAGEDNSKNEIFDKIIIFGLYIIKSLL